jgi:hypothetical protein
MTGELSDTHLLELFALSLRWVECRIHSHLHVVDDDPVAHDTMRLYHLMSVYMSAERGARWICVL